MGFAVGGVPSGDYLGTLTVNGQRYRQLLRVERVSGGEDAGPAIGEDEEDGREP